MVEQEVKLTHYEHFGQAVESWRRFTPQLSSVVRQKVFGVLEAKIIR